jgi:hypothetical protein
MCCCHADILDRLRPAIEHLHRLGPRVLAELLIEVGNKAGCMPAILAAVTRYQDLQPDALRVARGDGFPPVSPGRVELVTLRPVTPGLAYASVRVPGAHLRGLRITARADGEIAIVPPATTDRNGREWPAYALAPGFREAAEAAIADMWRASGR